MMDHDQAGISNYASRRMIKVSAKGWKQGLQPSVHTAAASTAVRAQACSSLGASQTFHTALSSN